MVLPFSTFILFQHHPRAASTPSNDGHPSQAPLPPQAQMIATVVIEGGPGFVASSSTPAIHAPYASAHAQGKEVDACTSKGCSDAVRSSRRCRLFVVLALAVCPLESAMTKSIRFRENVHRAGVVALHANFEIGRARRLLWP